MLTKTLKFDSDVLQVLQGIQWSEDGTHGTITQQLDRKLYERTNKALEAMGGKWNRGQKCHIFPTDPRPSVEGLLQSGALTVDRDGFFETPAALCERMVRIGNVNASKRILEPSAGLGAIARQIRYAGGSPVCIEINEGRCWQLREQNFETICGDFMEHTGTYDLIIMNPPFEQGQDIDHVLHAFELLANGGRIVSIMSEGAFFRSDKKSVAFREFLDAFGWSEELPAGTFKKSGTGVNTRLVVIDKE